MGQAYPNGGQWFRRPNGTFDEADRTVEIQFFDGTIDEVELDAWRDQLLVEVAAPDDWLGSVDMDPDDYVGTKAGEMPRGFHDALAIFNRK